MTCIVGRDFTFQVEYISEPFVMGTCHMTPPIEPHVLNIILVPTWEFIVHPLVICDEFLVSLHPVRVYI